MNAASFCASVHGVPVRPVLCLSAPLPGPGCPRGWGPGGAVRGRARPARCLSTGSLAASNQETLSRALCRRLAGSRTREVALPAPGVSPAGATCAEPQAPAGVGVHHAPVNREARRGPLGGTCGSTLTVTCQAAKVLARDQQAAMQGDRIEPAEAGLSQWFTGKATNFVLVPYTPGPRLQLCRVCF